MNKKQIEMTETKTIQFGTNVPDNWAKHNALSYYTMCRIQDTAGLSSAAGIARAIELNEIKGILTVDALGNFVSFE